METYNGHIRTPGDCLVLFEACRLGLLPRVQRRLSEKERQSIRTGSVFVWDEREAGMRRWTDGKSWSASRVSGSFLTYREMEGKRGSSNYVTPVGSKGSKTPDSNQQNGMDDGDHDEEPDGYRYKPDGLMKQSFSLTTSQGQHLHLISYYSRSHPTTQVLRQPTIDPTLTHIQIPKGMYPESTIADASNTPAVTRSPMPGAPNYVMAGGAEFSRPNPPPLPPFMPAYMAHPAYAYPLSPMHAPSGPFPFFHPNGYPGMYHHPGYHPGIPTLNLPHAPSSIFDKRPQGLHNHPPQSPPRHGSESGRPTSFHEINQQALALAGHIPPSQLTPKSDSQQSSSQIDPRLTETASTTPATNGQHSLSAPPAVSAPTAALPSPGLARQNSSRFYNPASTAASASINSLVHAAQQATPLPTNHRAGEARQDKEGSISPGGTKRAAPPQDIPSEKLAFREDKMALSKLDRVFARV